MKTKEKRRTYKRNEVQSHGELYEIRGNDKYVSQYEIQMIAVERRYLVPMRFINAL
jgi:hypothetical protein